MYGLFFLLMSVIIEKENQQSAERGKIMKHLKKAAVFMLILALGVSMAGCKKKAVVKKSDSEPKKVEEKKEEEAEKKEEPQEEMPANQNLLTGIADLTEGAIGKRPVAVMVNNVPPAMPQYGVGKADVIFEIPVEGDETRFMALFADYTTIPKICAIRSCRYYFPAFSQGFDAFYVNWGIDDSISDYLDALNMDQYDGIRNEGGFFGRDQERLNAGYALEHTGYFDGTQFASVVQAEGKRTDLNADKKGTAFKFNGLNEQVKPTGADCDNVHINFGAVTATMTYDTVNKVYLKQQNQNAQIDGSTGAQLSFTNVFVLETSISVRDELGHKQIDWEGGENSVGYYVSNGGVQKIHWQKDPNNESSYLRFYDESGNELKINRGKSYIAVNYPGQASFDAQ